MWFTKLQAFNISTPIQPPVPVSLHQCSQGPFYISAWLLGRHIVKFGCWNLSFILLRLLALWFRHIDMPYFYMIDVPVTSHILLLISPQLLSFPILISNIKSEEKINISPTFGSLDTLIQLFYVPQISKVIWYLSFWSTLPNIMFPISIQVVATCMILSFLTIECIAFHFTHLPQHHYSLTWHWLPWLIPYTSTILQLIIQYYNII